MTTKPNPEIVELIVLYVNTSHAPSCNALWDASEAVVTHGKPGSWRDAILARAALDAACWGARHYRKYDMDACDAPAPTWADIFAAANVLADHWYEEAKIQLEETT